MNKHSFISFLLLVLILPSFFAPTTLAQTPSPSPKASPVASVAPKLAVPIPSDLPTSGMNLTLSPTFLNLVTDPGVPVSSQLKIRNNSNQREYLEFNITSFTAEGTNGDTPVLKDIEPGDDFVNWISFSEEQFFVDPNEQKTIKFTITPPKEAYLGYYYALMVQRIKVQTPGEGQTVVAGAPSFLVILEVRSPLAKRELQLVNFKTSSPFYEYLPANFEMTFKNTGNIHLVPAGDIFIDQGNTKNVGVIRSNQFKGNILPGTERTYTASWDDGFIARLPKRDKDDNVIHNDKGDVIYETKVDFNKLTKFRIGKYTAHLVGVYDNGQRDIPLEGTVSFWVIPWKIILGALFILLILGFGLKSMFSSVFRKVRR